MLSPMRIFFTNQRLRILSAVAGIAIVGYFDYLTGTDIRIFPLYFLPISLAATSEGRWGARVSALLATATWCVSNALVGDRTWSTGIWIFNTAAQGAAFTAVALLISDLHGRMLFERMMRRRDSLTGLLNAHAFSEQAGTALAICRREGRPATIAFIDLDNFKAVNDSMGHEKGSEVLCAVADILRDSTRESDIVARFGGDEFVALLPGADAPQARFVLQRIRDRISTALAFPAASVTSSIGAVTSARLSGDLDDLLRLADTLMYQAKNRGKNTVVTESVA